MSERRRLRDDEPTSDFPLPRRRSSRPPEQRPQAAPDEPPREPEAPPAPAASEPGSSAEAGDPEGAGEAEARRGPEDEAAWLGWGAGPFGTPFGMFHKPPTEPLEAYGGSGETPAEPLDRERVKDEILQALRTVYDPEIPVNIVELGLIYSVEVTMDGKVDIEMTLTAPGCPVAGQLVEEVARKAGEVPGVAVSHVKLVWEPAWTPERMTEAARLELGFF